MTLLNTADKVYLGTQVADAVYAGAEKVWPPAASVGPPVTAGLKVWIDASQLALADGAAVSPWPNLVAGGAHGIAVNGYTAVPPKLKTNILNGKAVVHIDALEGRFVWNGTTGVSAPYTVIYIARITDLRVPVSRVVGTAYPPMNLIMGLYGNQKDVAYVGYFIGNSKPTVVDQWEMYSMDSPSVNGASRLWSNGVALSGGGGGEQHWAGSLVLGGYDPASVYDNQCPDADYAELVMYDRQLSDAERISVEGYLRTKWGLP